MQTCLKTSNLTTKLVLLTIMSTLGQQDIKLNNNAITMSFMFNRPIYDYIHMYKNKRFGLYFDHICPFNPTSWAK